MRTAAWTTSLFLFALLVACADRSPSPAPSRAEPRPSILLVTLDTTRADSIEPESKRVETPALAALAARGQRYTQAYSTAPMTLPAHASMLTGLTPAEHGVHENSRRLPGDRELLAERLRQLGYGTAAVISGFPLDRQFGLERGFAVYDDTLDRGIERRAEATTDRALELLEGAVSGPRFFWVHYYDPHEPYAPPPPFAERYPDDPYLGEIAYMDQQLGRLVAGFEERLGGDGVRILVVGDHGEGRGDHGEVLHGNLLYQGTMRVPLVMVAGDDSPAVHHQPVSITGVFDTVLGWAEGRPSPGLLGTSDGAVVGEAMKPFLQYGWQPQVMAVSGRLKAIRAGAIELYDVIDDPAEEHDLAGSVAISGELRQALSSYPLPASSSADAEAAELSEEERQQLAALGYVSWGGEARLRPDAPSPRQMTDLFADLDRVSALFVEQRYADAVPLFEQLQQRDPHNLIVAIRLAVAHSVLGEDAAAMRSFQRARQIDPESVDARHYLAMHLFQNGDWSRAAPLFEEVLAAMPERLPALRSLARIRERQGRVPEALDLLRRAVALERAPVDDLLLLGELAMATGDTAAAIDAFERSRAEQGAAFGHDLELGVCYLAMRQLLEARDALDRVPQSHPERPLALFKRAQVSVLLDEPDREVRVQEAYRVADPAVRQLIESERLFAGMPFR